MRCRVRPEHSAPNSTVWPRSALTVETIAKLSAALGERQARQYAVHVVRQRCVRDDYALGAAGGAGGVDDVGGVIAVNGRPGG